MTETLLETETVTTLAQPPKYAVILLNDDFTTMDFVIEILMDIFKMPLPNAFDLMLAVHHTGLGVAGIYDFQIAEMKQQAVHQRAQNAGFPLQCVLEKV